MTLSFQALREAQPSRLRLAAEAYESLGRASQEHFEAVRDAARWISRGGNWSGSAARAATERLERTNRRLDGAHTAMHGMAVLLREAAESFELAQAKLLAVVDEAGRAGVRVAEDGSLTPPVLGPSAGHDPDCHVPEQVVAFTQRIQHAVAEADAADQQVAELLARLAWSAENGDGLRPETAESHLAGITGLGRKLAALGWPPEDAAPAQVHDWWQHLTAAEQQQLIADHPDLIGNRDGIPCAARDQANRAMLPALIDRYRQKHQPLSPEDQRKLDGFLSLRQRLSEEPAEPRLLLLGLSDQGQGRAALAWGDPDSARHVATLVPGLNSTLAAVGQGDAETALRLYRSAEQAADGEGVATLLWLGYDAPQSDGLSVASRDRAAAGALAYNRFLDGLASTHDGPAHLTAIGHSYGSLLVGQAAQRPGGIPADEVVLVGSPGTGAEHAGQLSVGAEHVYVGAARYDPVTHLPAHSEVVSAGALGPAGPLISHAAEPHALWFGQDPAGTEFGARRFSVADGTPADSHDDYFGKSGKGGDSLPNIGRIVAGRLDQVSWEEGR